MPRSRVRVAAATAVIASACAWAGTATAQPTIIYVRNESTLVTDAEITNALPAFQQAIDQDFAPIWHASADLAFIGSAAAAPGAETVTITDERDCFVCAGYHDETGGVPYAKVFPVAGAWQVTFSHELFEMLADPTTSSPRAVHTRRGWYLVEVADPVEADALAYTRPGLDGQPVSISDFVTPRWYSGGTSGAWDFAHHCKRKLQILPGGYQLRWSDGTWKDVWK